MDLGRAPMPCQGLLEESTSFKFFTKGPTIDGLAPFFSTTYCSKDLNYEKHHFLRFNFFTHFRLYLQ
jgi:hypothetical protein